MSQVGALNRTHETLAVFLLSGLLSCAAQSALPKTTDPITEALLHSQESIYQSIVTDTEAEEAQDEISFMVRFNPAPCECPDWEMNYRQRWQRVMLIHEVDDAAPVLGMPSLSSHLDEHAVLEFMGYFGDTFTQPETGLSYRTIHVSGPVSPKSPILNSN